MDKRWKELGKMLVDYSLEIHSGEKVMIAMVEAETYPLVLAVYESCIKAGALPQVQFLSEELNRLILKFGSKEQIRWLPEIERYGMEWADVYLGLRGAHNLDVFWDVPAKDLSDYRRTMGKISTLRWQNTRWCVMRVPNTALAHQAGIDEETIMDVYFKSCLLDWNSLRIEWQRIAELLAKGKQVRILGNQTDLSFSVEGRTWDVADGKINMPDGEIETSPLETTADGEIYFERPAVLGGRLVHDLRLRWEKGKLVESTSTSNQDFLNEIIGIDEGAGLIGEFAFGTNPELKYFSNDILLDEKIGGTIHIALGRAYPETGGTNKSAIHWDIIKDLRKEGQVFLDGRCIFEKGEFLI